MKLAKAERARRALARQTAPKTDFSRYKHDPVGFVRDVLGEDPWDKQRQILEALSREPAVTVRSCHGAGKTVTASWAVLWFTQTRPGSVAITTAPTARQVRDLLWRRVNGSFRRAKVPLIGRCLTTKWESVEDIEWYATGFATDDQVGFQGPHSAAGVLFVGDEASGLKEWLFESVKGWMTQDDAKMLLIGNPNHASGYFYESHRRWPASQRFHISAYDVPPHILLPSWIDGMKRDYGETSPVYHVRVLGEFPPQGEDTIISLAWAEAAQNREREPGKPCEMGVDVARYGGDETCVYVRQGDRVVDAHYWRGQSVTQVVGRVAELAKRWQPEAIKVDEIGIGAGVVDGLEAEGWPAIGVNVGQSATIKPDEYENLRTEIFMDLAERFRDGSIDIPLDDQMLVDQLTSLTYSYTPKGKRKLVSKEDMRKARQGASLWSSPDRGDALALCFAANLGGWAPVVISGPPREDGGWKPGESPQGVPPPW